MKDAEIDDHWRHVQEKEYPTRIAKVKYNNIPGIGKGEIAFNSGLNAICGSNGAGKSTLMRCIACLLDKSALDIFPEIQKKVIKGTIDMELFVKGAMYNFQYDFGSKDYRGQEKTGVNSTWFEPTKEIPHILKVINETEHLDEMIESIEPDILGDNNLYDLSYIINKSYSEIMIYEIDNFAGYDVLPYFKVISNGISYTSELMGLGEYSLFHLYWLINHMEKLSILLIEEPECFIYPRSQQYLMNLLAKISSKKKIWCLLTTHSPQVLKKIHFSNINIISSGNPTSVLINATDPIDYISILDDSVSKEGIIFVEDYAAKLFLSNIVAKFDQNLLKRFSIAMCGSHSDIERLLKGFPDEGHWLKVIGIVDGGLKKEYKDFNSKWNIMSLPGGDPPDKILTDCLRNNSANISESMEIDLNKLNLGIGTVAGAEYHDFVSALAQQISRNCDTVNEHIFNCWYKIGENSDKCRAFYDDLLANITSQE